MIFKPNMSAEIQDWITPQQVEVVKVETHTERLDRIQQRAKELREAMGPRYLCHEENRVRRRMPDVPVTRRPQCKRQGHETRGVNR